MAEYIVSRDVECESEKRIEWDAYDLLSKNGIKIEVKSSSYLQSWDQRELSKISFSIKETPHYDLDSGKFLSEKSRQSDVYIFCVLEHKDKRTVNPLDLNQWSFYVISTQALNEKCSD